MNARWLALAALVGLTGQGRGQAPGFRLEERTAPGDQYNVRMRVDLSGTLTPPPDKAGKRPPSIAMEGDSAIEYDERILKVEKGEVSRTLRIVRRMDFRRTMAKQKQQLSLRPAVRRLVILRQGNTEVPFSPDGPLTWGELDLVRTDVFTPALAGLLPGRSVSVGERWNASTLAVRELTDMEKIDSGELECRLEGTGLREGRRMARVSFSGTIAGTGEDGRSRQKLTGSLEFDVDGGFLASLQLRGVHALLDKEGQEVGRIEGRCFLTRERTRAAELSDARLRGVELEPNTNNSMVLYDNTDLGLRLHLPRRWRIGRVSGNQVALEGLDGSSLMLTLDPAEKVPSVEKFARESRAFLEKHKARVMRVERTERLTAYHERFGFEADLEGQPFWMVYHIVRQAHGGLTLAARLPNRDVATLRQEVERIARAAVLTRRVTERKP